MYIIKSQKIKSSHGFSTRLGGVSSAEHTKSLNLAFDRGDSDGTVLENLEMFCRELELDSKNIISHPQIHSNKVIKVTEHFYF